MAPLIIGRDVSRIEDIWPSIYTAGYWRNDAIGNTVQSGIDMALWDIKGKEAGMPVYQLLGGKTRSAVAAYAHAQGNSLTELEDDVRRYWQKGYTVIRCQLGNYGNDQPGLDLDVNKARALLDPEKARKTYYMAEDRHRDGSIVRL